jgi:hypothetical protein
MNWSVGGTLTHCFNFVISKCPSTPATSEASVIVEVIIGLNHRPSVDDFAATVWADSFEALSHDGFLAKVVLVTPNVKLRGGRDNDRPAENNVSPT